MTETLSFPGLGPNGIHFDINPVIFQITPTWAIKWYGVIVTLAFVLGCAYVLRRVKAFGLDMDRVLDVLLGAVIGGIVGARAFYVIFAWQEQQFANDFLRVFRIWEGGIAIYGGIIGGMLVGALMCRIRKVKLLPMMDLAAAGLILGQAIGRWGNFINMEAFGSNTTAPWGMTSPTITAHLLRDQAKLAAQGVMVDPFSPVHPTFFYESLWCFIGFALLVWLTKRRRFDGQLILTYAGWYGLGRVWIEGLRTDSLMLGDLRISQAVALICVIASVVALFSIFSRIRTSGDPHYMELYVNTPEGRAVVNGTFYSGEWLAGAAAPASAPEQTLATPAMGIRNLRPRRSRLRGAKKMAAVRLAHRRPRRIGRR